jgi:hypothetical protein
MGERFSTPVQTGPGAHLVSYTMGIGSVPGVKWSGHGVYLLPHPAPRLTEEKHYTTTPLLGFRRLFQVGIEIYCYTKEINSLYLQCMFPSYENSL